MGDGTLLRLAAFTTDPAGGNPAGVWIGDELPPAHEMQRIAAEVGYSETAFLAPDGDPGRFRVRYFSPLAEVPFCGHATIAAGVALADRGAPPAIILRTNDGEVPVEVALAADGLTTAMLTSVGPKVERAPSGLLEPAMGLLGWSGSDLDPALPPAVSYAGARHLIIAVAERATLAAMAYPFEPMQGLMLEHDLTTLQLIWRETPTRFRARDPFAVGGVVEDPATGAAAAALGAYLRDRGELTAPATFQILQGEEMGRPSLLTVELVADDPRVRVRGNAVPI